jgi:8-oxo-dGTP pyrophosphatase MutT (NUDIX family)
MSDQALLREISEELGVTAELGRLVWVVENRFGHSDRRFHEIGFCYCVDLPKQLAPGAPANLQLPSFAYGFDGSRPMRSLRSICGQPYYARGSLHCPKPFS